MKRKSWSICCYNFVISRTPSPLVYLCVTHALERWHSKNAFCWVFSTGHLIRRKKQSASCYPYLSRWLKFKNKPWKHFYQMKHLSPLDKLRLCFSINKSFLLFLLNPLALHRWRATLRPPNCWGHPRSGYVIAWRCHGDDCSRHRFWNWFL